MVAPSGEQYEISAARYRAVVTESGAGLRALEYDGHALVDGYAAHERSSHGRGQLLMPWPNRIEDGAYTFGGTDHQLALSEPSRHNAIHGLVRWSSWTLEEHTGNTVSLVYRLLAQTGYPWTVDLHVLYDLSADGLTVTMTATNLGDSPAPYAQGAHPYLTVGDGGIDGWTLTLPARVRVASDERMLPAGRADVAHGPFDFWAPRPLGTTVFDHAFTDLARGPDGRAEVVLGDPGTGRAVALWMDEAYGWVQVFSGEPMGDAARRSLAVEPMTAGANAFRTGEDLILLAPAGRGGDEHSSSWGIRSA